MRLISERQLSRNHHTIPESYQAGFRDKKARLNIWRYEKGSERIAHHRIKDESVIQDYYSTTDEQGGLDDRLEHEMLARYEGSAKKVVEQMRQKKPPYRGGPGLLLHIRSPHVPANAGCEAAGGSDGPGGRAGPSHQDRG